MTWVGLKDRPVGKIVSVKTIGRGVKRSQKEKQKVPSLSLAFSVLTTADTLHPNIQTRKIRWGNEKLEWFLGGLEFIIIEMFFDWFDQKLESKSLDTLDLDMSSTVTCVIIISACQQQPY